MRQTTHASWMVGAQRTSPADTLTAAIRGLVRARGVQLVAQATCDALFFGLLVASVATVATPN